MLPEGVEAVSVPRSPADDPDISRGGVHAEDALPDLIPLADVVVLLVPLTPATEGMITPTCWAR